MSSKSKQPKTGAFSSPDEAARHWLGVWTRRLGVTRAVRTERTSVWHVTREDGRRGCSLVGVVLRPGDEAVIYHTRRLTEEDVVHELLHVAHPDWDEAAVVRETARTLSAWGRCRPARLTWPVAPRGDTVRQRAAKTGN